MDDDNSEKKPRTDKGKVMPSMMLLMMGYNYIIQ